MEQWAVKNGTSAGAGSMQYSPEVDARVARAQEIAKRYEVQGTLPSWSMALPHLEQHDALVLAS